MTEGVRLLSMGEVRAKVPLSVPTIYELIKKGLFPKQVKVGLSRSFWLESEIDAWLASRVAARSE